MKLGSLAGARAAYYDRDATSIHQNYYSIAVPHSVIVRFLVTVAAGKKLLIESQAVRSHRRTVATTAGEYYAEIIYKDSFIDVLGCSIHATTATTNVQHLLIGPQQVTLFPGEQVQCRTYDISIGGSVEYWASFKGTLYTA